MKCNRCNAEFENAKFCPQCGLPVPKYGESKPNGESNQNTDINKYAETYNQKPDMQDISGQGGFSSQNNDTDVDYGDNFNDDEDINQSPQNSPVYQPQNSSYAYNNPRDGYDNYQDYQNGRPSYNGNQYGGNRGKSPKKKNTAKIVVLVIMIIVVLAAIGFLIFSVFGMGRDNVDNILPTAATQSTAEVQTEPEEETQEPATEEDDDDDGDYIFEEEPTAKPQEPTEPPAPTEPPTQEPTYYEPPTEAAAPTQVPEYNDYVSSSDESGASDTL